MVLVNHLFKTISGDLNFLDHGKIKIKRTLILVFLIKMQKT